MSASFRRKGRRDDTFGLKGTKLWTGGITQTSVGLRDLDTILGGGQPLGTCLLVEEDRWTRDLATCFVKYWCAEAVSHEQVVLIPFTHSADSTLPNSVPTLLNDNFPSLHKQGATASQIETLLKSLPRNLHWDKAGEILLPNDSSRPLEILDEEDDEDAEGGLQIAWQYRKSIQNERLGHAQTSTTKPSTTNIYCHSFDLSGRLEEQNYNRDCIHLLDVTCCHSDAVCRKRTCGIRFFQTLKQHFEDLPKGKVIRLLLYQADLETISMAVPLLLAHIRSEALPVVIMVATQTWTCQSETSLINIRRASDVIIQTEGFASRVQYPPPAEFRHLHGLMLLPKVSTVTAAAANGGGHFADMTMSKRPPAHVYGLKRDRRKLHVPLLHIPPEDYASEGGSAGGGVRSGAGRPNEKVTGCGSTGGNSILDF